MAGSGNDVDSIESIMAALSAALFDTITTMAPAASLVVADRIDRQRLDFSVDSLCAIDQYLTEVYVMNRSTKGVSLFTTIWVLAVYVGEVIRRGAPNLNYKWVAIDDHMSAGGHSALSLSELGPIWALRAKNGDMIMPNLAVLRVVLRGPKARTIQSFAKGAMGMLDAARSASIQRIPGPAAIGMWGRGRSPETITAPAIGA